MAAFSDNNLPLVPQTPTVGRVTRKFVERLSDTQRKQAIAASWQAYLGMLPNPLTIEPGEPDLNVNVNRIAPIVDTGVAWLMGASLGIEVDPEQPLLALDDALDDGTTVEGSIGAASDTIDPDADVDAVERSQGIPDADALNIGDVDSDEANGAIAAIDAALKTPEEAENPKVKAAQDYLDGCWGDEDERMTTLAKLATNGGICGHFFAKILPPDVQAGREYPRLVVLDPQNVTMQTDPEDCDCVNSYTICFDSESPVDGTIIQKRQVIARKENGPGRADDTWMIANYARSTDGSDWTQLGPATEWQHPWPPIIDGPNMPLPNQRWGLPDVTPNLINLNKAINFVASNINAIGYSHGHPWLWASGTNAQMIKVAPGYVTGLPNPQAQMGAIQAHGDIAGLMQYEADLRADMDEQSKVPAVATGRISELPRGQQSGVTIRLLHTPLTFKTTFKQRTYGKAIREANARMLALGGFGDGTDLGGVKTILHWQDPLPVDDLQQAQAALTWSQLGVSGDTLMAKGGFDPEVERRKNAEANARDLSSFTKGEGMPPSPEQMAQQTQPAQDQQAQQQQPPMDGAMGGDMSMNGMSMGTTPATSQPAAVAPKPRRTRSKVAKGGN